jgi:hypothetical protein
MPALWKRAFFQRVTSRLHLLHFARQVVVQQGDGGPRPD